MHAIVVIGESLVLKAMASGLIADAAELDG